MSKSIKISEDAYNGLHELQRPRETISGVVERLLAINTLLEKATPLIRQQQANLQDWRPRDIEKKAVNR